MMRLSTRTDSKILLPHRPDQPLDEVEMFLRRVHRCHNAGHDATEPIAPTAQRIIDISTAMPLTHAGATCQAGGTIALPCVCLGL